MGTSARESRPHNVSLSPSSCGYRPAAGRMARPMTGVPRATGVQLKPEKTRHAIRCRTQSNTSSFCLRFQTQVRNPDLFETCSPASARPPDQTVAMVSVHSVRPECSCMHRVFISRPPTASTGFCYSSLGVAEPLFAVGCTPWSEYTTSVCRLLPLLVPVSILLPSTT